MRKNWYKLIISFGLICMGVLIFEVEVNAASFDSMKDHVLNGTGELMHPNLYREMTEEEKEDFKDDPNAPTQINRAMTEQEVNEYIYYVEKYQKENDTSEVPYEAYDYVQYIAEEMDRNQSLEITNDLREEAEMFANKQHKKGENQNSSSESSEIRSVVVVLEKFMAIQLFV
ncbi:hypothetical protein [Enterococcus sp. AZ192]|uniref:hypothetical protein n=1 Tax=unclassified Enterococcus TaxID=2608891 RepID=UPI003D28FE76